MIEYNRFGEPVSGSALKRKAYNGFKPKVLWEDSIMNFKATVVVVMLIFVILLSGCGKPNNTSSTSSSVSISATPTVQQEDSLPESSSSTESSEVAAYFESAEKHIVGDKTYYLDERELKTLENTTGYMLYYRDNINGIDTPVNILAFSIKAYGEYIYILTSKNGDFQSNLIGDDTVYRLDKDGNKKFICDGYFYDLIEYALYQVDDSLYFTRFNENSIFKSDLNCDEIESIPLILPEQDKTFTELRIIEYGNLYSKYNIRELKGGILLFYYTIVNDSNQPLFSGSYSMSVADNHIVKNHSWFHDYRQTVGEWLFYLDLNNPMAVDEGTYYEIHRSNPDGSSDVNLKIQCFRFDVTMNYIYADADLSYGDFAHWTTYRYDFDGLGKKELEYSDMMRYSEGNRLYFAENWDDIIYVADTACNVLIEIKVTVPDEATLKTTLGYRYYLITILVTDREGDWLNFDYSVGDPGGQYYYGHYRINLESKIVEKLSGEYDLPAIEDGVN